MEVVFLEKFVKDLDKIKDKNTRKRIAQAIEKLETADTLEQITGLTKLVGFSSYYRIRVGDYRMGIIVDNQTVELARVAHRKEIYRLFP